MGSSSPAPRRRHGRRARMAAERVAAGRWENHPRAYAESADRPAHPWACGGWRGGSRGSTAAVCPDAVLGYRVSGVISDEPARGVRSAAVFEGLGGPKVRVAGAAPCGAGGPRGSGRATPPSPSPSPPSRPSSCSGTWSPGGSDPTRPQPAPRPRVRSQQRCASGRAPQAGLEGGITRPGSGWPRSLAVRPTWGPWAQAARTSGMPGEGLECLVATGFFFANLVIRDARINAQQLRRAGPPLRDQNQNEVDVVVTCPTVHGASSR